MVRPQLTGQKTVLSVYLSLSLSLSLSSLVRELFHSFWSEKTFTIIKQQTLHTHKTSPRTNDTIFTSFKLQPSATRESKRWEVSWCDDVDVVKLRWCNSLAAYQLKLNITEIPVETRIFLFEQNHNPVRPMHYFWLYCSHQALFHSRLNIM